MLATRSRLSLPPFPFNSSWALEGLELFIPFYDEKLRSSIVSFDNKHHLGTLTGTSYVQDLGRLFDFVDDKAVIPHHASLNTVGQCTIIVWVRPTNEWNATATHQILDKRSDAGGIAPTLLWRDAGATSNIGIFAGIHCVTGADRQLAAGTCYMIAGMAVEGVVGGAGNKVWLDGVDDTTATDTATFVTNTDDLVIGAAFGDPLYSNFLDADLIELWFYPTRAFTDAEMLAFFRETNERGQYK